MKHSYYLPLIEKIRNRIGSWSAKFLSFAGRLQLLNSVIFSLTNFWMAAFRLPKSCIAEIDKLCSAFLWSGSDLNTKKAKISWTKVCTPKGEGGLGIKSLEEVNKIFDQRKFLLGGQRNLKLWLVDMEKMLKYRDAAKRFYKIEVRNGYQVSFWYDEWCLIGQLYETLGPRGIIDMGILVTTTLGSVMDTNRSRWHQNPLLNRVESEIQVLNLNRNVELEDIKLWKGRNNEYISKFITKDTWEGLRVPGLVWSPHKGTWFSYNSPKFSFLTWLASHNRLSTGDRMSRCYINTNTSCVFCKTTLETRDHLFFLCPITCQMWKSLIKEVMGSMFTNVWQDIIAHTISSPSLGHTKLFLVRYVFQAAIHTLWCERNNRRHGEPPCTSSLLIRIIDTTVRNRLTTMRREGVKRYEDGLRTWFATRFV